VYKYAFQHQLSLYITKCCVVFALRKSGKKQQKKNLNPKHIFCTGKKTAADTREEKEKRIHSPLAFTVLFSPATRARTHTHKRTKQRTEEEEEKS
jgi:hypothetical protein